MANKKIAGIRKVSDRNYKIDTILIINGKRVHIRKSGFSSAQEARDALPGILEAKRREKHPYVSSATFDALCDDYLDNRCTQIKVQTVESERYTIRKHIIPYFTGLAVSEALTFKRVSSWYRGKCVTNKDSAARKNKIFSIMRQIIDCAWKWHHITSETHQDLMSLIANVRLPNKAKSEAGVWNYDEMQRFLEAIPKDSIDYPMMSLFCYLGCRIGEFLGLQWGCFNQRQSTITIGQQVIHMRGGAVLTDELKTNESYRVNQLDESTANLLVNYRSTLNSSDDDEFIFPSPYNSRAPLSKSEFRRRFYDYIGLSGVPRIVPHGVRHSKATMLAGVCRTAEEVAVGAKFLGHSSAMFMGTYVAQNGISQSDLVARLSNKRHEA